AVWTLFSLGVVLLLSGLIPAASQPQASPTTPPRTLAVDWLFLLPYVSLKYLTPLWLIVLATVIIVYGLYIPYQLPETRAEMGLRESGIAQVIDANCTGCELCSWRRSHGDRKSTRLNSSHLVSSYAVFCLKKKNK